MKHLRLSSRDAIIQAAFIEFAQRPKASLSSVATRAGVGRATLHRHFRTRKDLVYQVAQTAARELESAATAAAKRADSASEALRLILEAIISLGDRQWFLSHQDLDEFPDLSLDEQRQKNEFHQLMKAAQKEGLFPEGCPVPWAVSAYDHLVYGAWMLIKSGEATPKQASKLAWTTFESGIRGASI